MESRITRRTLLRRTAALTTGVVAAGTTKFSAADGTPPEPMTAAPDHDPASGEIFDRDRHHRWDTV